MMAYCFVYRTLKGLRAIGSDVPEWSGRRGLLIKTYMIWDDGTLTPVANRFAEKLAS